MTKETETLMTDKKFNKPLRVEIWHDYDTESPDEHDGLFRLISFNSRHVSHESPESVLACQFETTFTDDDGFEEWDACDSGPHEPTDNGGHDDAFPAHEYEPPQPIAAFLSYYEHGLGMWSRMGNGPADYGGFDTTPFAGVLIVDTDRYGESELDYWFNWPKEVQLAQIDSFLETYTDWANGQTYGWNIEKRSEDCPTCHRENPAEPLDSCGGFIGLEWACEALRAELAAIWEIDAKDLIPGEHFTVAKGSDTLIDADDVMMYAGWADERVEKMDEVMGRTKT